MVEKWENISGFDGDYQISNFGRVKSTNRIVIYMGKNQTGAEFKVQRIFPERILKTYIRGGYEHVNLKRKSKSYNYSIHRLVATYFLQNPNNYSIINHKDENKLNNKFDNLEWCDSKYNANYGTRNDRIARKLKDNPNFYIPVLCYDLNNNFIKKYDSAEQAAKEIGISGSGITACCRLYFGRTSAGGYKWKYEHSCINIDEINYVSQKKCVHQFSDDGVFIATYDSISSAATALNKDVHNFAKSVKKGYAFGFFWIVNNNFENINKLISEFKNHKFHIYQIDKNGVIIEKFKSALDVENKLGLNHSNISNCLNSLTKNGKHFRTCGGFYWIDINKYPDYNIDFNFKKGHGETKIAQYDLNGNKLREFSSIRDAQEFLGIDRNKTSAIYDCFKPNSKKEIAYNFIWKKI